MVGEDAALECAAAEAPGAIDISAEDQGSSDSDGIGAAVSEAVQDFGTGPCRLACHAIRSFCSSMGAECASAHMMRNNTKIQINSANSD